MTNRSARVRSFATMAVIAVTSVLASSQTRVQVKDRTTALVRALSPADVYHSTLFDGIGQFQKPLDSLTSVDVIDDFAQTGAPPATADLIRLAACSTDTAFSGVVTGATSHPSRDGLFLWTSYRVRVVKSLRNRTGGASPSGVVTVVRPGGSITLEGMTVEARSKASPPLAVGTQYYLFTSYLDRTSAYKSGSRNGTYQLADKSVSLVGVTTDARLNEGMPVDEFEASLRGLTCGR